MPFAFLFALQNCIRDYSAEGKNVIPLIKDLWQRPPAQHFLEVLLYGWPCFVLGFPVFFLYISPWFVSLCYAWFFDGLGASMRHPEGHMETSWNSLSSSRIGLVLFLVVSAFPRCFVMTLSICPNHVFKNRRSVVCSPAVFSDSVFRSARFPPTTRYAVLQQSRLFSYFI